jgi:hypothetical protein
MSVDMAGPQFETRAGRLSNLDRCHRCGVPRSAHGADWSCPPGLSGRGRLPLLAIGGVLSVAGGILWGLSSSAAAAASTLSGLAFLGGLLLLITASVSGGR